MEIDVHFLSKYYVKKENKTTHRIVCLLHICAKTLSKQKMINTIVEETLDHPKLLSDLFLRTSVR